MTTQLHPQEGMVLEFLEAFGVNQSNEVCTKLIEEEVSEVIEAAAHLLKELCDLMYVTVSAQMQGSAVPGEAYGPPAIDGLFSLFPDEVFNEAFKRVHESNMSKLVDGKPLRREDGKILKSPNYKPPYLLDLIK